MRSLVLPSAQQRRIARLAQLASRTPEPMLRFVLRGLRHYLELDA